MPNRVLSEARKELLAALPEAITRAMASYTEYASSHDHDAADGDAKTYAAHHAGLKSAISHLEALIKLGRLIMVENQAEFDRSDEPLDSLPTLIEKAQAALVVLDHDTQTYLPVINHESEPERK